MDKIIKKTFKIKTNLSVVTPVIKEILDCLKPANISPGVLHDIKLAAEEAMINAIKHGNRFQEGLPVVIDFKRSKDRVSISVQDAGKGYDYTRVPDPTLDENIAKGNGRGVFLIRRIMDEVHFNKSGNKIEMVKYIKKKDKEGLIRKGR